MPTKRKKAAFISIAIIGFLIIPMILYLIAFLLFGLTTGKERDVMQELNTDVLRELDINEISLALEAYYKEYNSYPSSLDELFPKYLLSLPLDPLTKQPYQYQLQQNGMDYKICTQLESTKIQKCITSKR